MSDFRQELLKHTTIVALALAAALLAPGVSRAAGADPAAPSASASEDDYVAAMRARLDRHRRYPTGREASLARPTGTTEVVFEVDRDGRVRSSAVVQSSLSMLLDDTARTLVRRERFDAFPADTFAGASTHRFVVAYAFRTGRFSADPGDLVQVAVR